MASLASVFTKVATERPDLAARVNGLTAACFDDPRKHRALIQPVADQLAAAGVDGPARALAAELDELYVERSTLVPAVPAVREAETEAGPQVP